MDKKMRGVFNTPKHGKCKRRGACFLCNKKKYTASECMEIMHACLQTMCGPINKRMDVSTEQHYNIKFCVRLQKLNVETIALLKTVFQNETSHDLTIHRWNGAFTHSRVSAEIEHLGERPRTGTADVNNDTVLVVIGEDRHSTIQKLADD